MENKPCNLNRFLDEAQPDWERPRPMAQTLAGEALVSKKENGPEHPVGMPGTEQAALEKLVANGRARLDQRLAMDEGTLFDTGGR